MDGWINGRVMTVNGSAAKLNFRTRLVPVAKFLFPWKPYCITVKGRKQGNTSFYLGFSRLLIPAVLTLTHIQLALMLAAHVFGFSIKKKKKHKPAFVCQSC